MNHLLHPETLSSFRTPLSTGEITLTVHTSPDKPPRTHVIRNIYPFMTLYDVKLAIYIAFDMNDDALPDYVFVGTSTGIGKRIKPLEYGWSEPAQPTDGFSLLNPFDSLTKKTPDARFVDSAGARKVLAFHPRQRLLIESSVIAKKQDTPLNVFLYKNIEAAIPGERPVGERDWNGYLYPYFPRLSVENHTPTEEYREIVQRSARAFIKKREFYDVLEKHLTSGTMYPLVLTGIRALRIQYIKPKVIAGIETIFYNTPVNSVRPYMRLLPVEGGPISKLHMVDDKPDIEDPRLLLQWGQERTLTPDRDSAFVKILIRKRSGTISPLYCTLRLLDDGTADITLEPPKGVRKLDPRSELDDFPKILQTAMEGFPYIKEAPTGINGMFVFGLHLKDVTSAYTASTLRAKLPVFSSVFQEIPALTGETPLLMLRYKLINNFTNEDRIQTFITQVMSRKVVIGDANYSDLVELVADEFDIELTEARKRVADKLKGQGDVVVTDDDTMYALQSNTGVDVGIFGQHPFYSFHVYRVDSQHTLQRIISLLSILFSRSATELHVSKQAVREVTRAAEAEPESDAEEENNFKSVPEEAPEEAAESSEPPVARDSEFYEDLMFDVSEQPTLEEEFGSVEAADEGDARPEGALSPIREETEAPVSTAQSLRKQIANDVERPSSIQAVEPSKKVEVSAASGKGFETYFSDKLKDADRKLFDFHKTHPSLTKYVTQCASNLMRQPAVMTEPQFNAMVKEYDDVLKSKAIEFIVFPIGKDEKKQPYKHPISEYYTFMRYGTSDGVQNYYVCCKYFCTRDGMLVREKELIGTVLRRPVKNADGTTRNEKEPGTCPFCEGKLIKNRRFPGVNETIIERGVKAGTVDSRHLYIRFLKKTNHPDGFYLPCCFLEDQPIRVGNPAYPEATSHAAPSVLTEDIHEDSDDETPQTPASTTTSGKEKVITYETTMIGAWKEYIVGSEKLPLEGIVKRYKKVRDDKKDRDRLGEAGKLSEPQIGLLPPQLNPYFSQDSLELVSRTFNPQKLKVGAEGFLRIGVENTSRYSNDSFLSAVAPFFGQNSAAAMKSMLSDPLNVPPSVFVALNYGNLLLEMYKPNAKRPAITTTQTILNDDIKLWARENLRIKKVTTNNEELVIRAYMSYTKYIEWLESDTTKKEYRHFANLFLQPELLQLSTARVAGTDAAVQEKPRGIVFIVLDMLKSGEVKIRCPPYPIANDILMKSDIGFLFHHYSGIWEPIFYFDNKTPAERKLSSYMLRFVSRRREAWPKIVERRALEFMEQCKTSTGGKGYYTSFAGITSKKCIGISALRNELLEYNASIKYYGLIRDTYNHVAAAVYKNESDNLIAIPVIDDGLSPTLVDGVLILDWDDYTPAPLDQMLAFYKKYIYLHHSFNYAIQRQIKSKGSGRVEAVQLKNGLYVPVAPAAEGLVIELPDPIIGEIAEMEWTINKKIIMGASYDEPPGDEARIHVKEFNEVYEHLRLTFSNWLHTQEDGSDLRTVLETTIYRHDIPLFEKRKRLEILLGSTIESWISESDEDSQKQASLLRVDCLLRPESECGGRCSWVQEGKCLIHAPTKSPYSETASATHILLSRLIEELLRFGERRKQLFERRVQQLANIDAPIRDGNQYIVPEKSAEWTELLRMEWSLEHTDVPVYLEEITTPYANNPAAAAASSIPPELAEILGDDAKKFHLYPSPTKNLVPFLNLLNVLAKDVELTDSSSELTLSSLKALVRKISMPVVQIDMRVQPPKVLVRQPLRDTATGYPIFILQDTTNFPVSILVTNPENAGFLQANELPEALKTLINKSDKIFKAAAK